MPRPKARAAVHDLTDDETMAIDTTFLDGLQSDGFRASLEAVDELQTCGLGDLLALPEIVVCGDQSAGKSSLLARLTQVEFPQDEDICTRFATQIVLRRSQKEAITVKIMPGPRTSEAEKKKLAKFGKELQDFTNFPQLIQDATTAMGLHKLGTGHNAFSPHRVCIEITGPTRGHFSLLDLPGLIRTSTKVQTADDIAFVKALHHDILANPRAIILAVMSANVNIAVHEILTICEKHDPAGMRTLGIITKPDKLAPGSKEERSYLELARNKHRPLNLGWHVVKNWSDLDKTADFAARTQAEDAFFNSGVWKGLHAEQKGISTLRDHISDLRFKLHKQELPKLQQEVTTVLQEKCDQLKLLGEKRSDVTDQRRLLRAISTDVSSIVKAAVDGNFTNAFFPPAGKRVAADNAKFLSSTVADLQDQFTARMEVSGHKYQFLETNEAAGTNSLNKRTWKIDGKPTREDKKNYTRAQAVDWVLGLLKATRGSELPGSFSTALVNDAFQEQSEPWVGIAEKHMFQVDEACSDLIRVAIRSKAPVDLAEKILAFVDDDMTRRCNNAEAQLDELIRDKELSTAVYDPAYASNVQKLLNHRLDHELAAASANGQAYGMQARHVSRTIAEATQNDSPRMAAEKALDNQLVLYEGRRATFITNVAQQVIERHLLRDLAEETFSPKVIDDLSDEQVSELASEPPRVSREREDLERQRITLEKSRKVFQRIMNPLKRAVDDMEEVVATGSARKRRARKSLLD